MPDILTITANWATGSLSNSVLSRQYDHNRYRVEFMGYPESISEDLHFYLLVWMKADEQSPARGLAPIELDSDQWVITNYFTQLVQPIRFQLCVRAESGDFEAHSPIFSGSVADSLEHDGESQDINIKGLFDRYKAYVEALILDSGARIVDTELDENSDHLVTNAAVASSIASIGFDIVVDANGNATLARSDMVNTEEVSY